MVITNNAIQDSFGLFPWWWKLFWDNIEVEQLLCFFKDHFVISYGSDIEPFTAYLAMGIGVGSLGRRILKGRTFTSAAGTSN